ncbi:MAG TPA: HAD family acid phosphatase [Candidatus Wallbacteria bacterium]|nr:HAD family acid phosphatase [Candidatus Wallbacteria bacterium]
MVKISKVILSFLFFALLLTGCLSSDDTTYVLGTQPGQLPTNLDTVKQQIIQYRDSGNWGRELDAAGDKGVALLRAAYNQNDTQAVVFDIDETTLDNYDNMKKDNFAIVKESSVAWMTSAKAPAVNGSKKIYDEAVSKGIYVFFITGRAESLRAVTANNLNVAGYTKYEKMIMHETTGETALVYKTAARASVEKAGYRIILNVGDQDSDLLGGYSLNTLKLPNPMYILN